MLFWGRTQTLSVNISIPMLGWTGITPTSFSPYRKFIRSDCEYPGEWDGEIERVIATDTHIMIATHIFSKDKGTLLPCYFFYPYCGRQNHIYRWILGRQRCRSPMAAGKAHWNKNQKLSKQQSQKRHSSRTATFLWTLVKTTLTNRFSKIHVGGLCPPEWVS